MHRGTVTAALRSECGTIVRPQPCREMGPSFEEARDFVGHAPSIAEVSDRTARAARANRGREDVLTG